MFKKMKYLKLFQTETEYNSFKEGGEYITPNVSLILSGSNGSRTVKYQTKIKQLAKVGDIAYWDGGSVKTTPLSSWNLSLGTPVGVVMIPENFLPDGKARIISLTNMTYNASEYMQWDETGGMSTDSPAPNFDYVVGTDNTGSTTYGAYGYGSLPSDRSDWGGTQSYVDPLTRYYYTTEEYNNWGEGMCPSPYLSNGSFNPTYSAYIEGGNVLSDFNGLSNTQLLVNKGEQYVAANACRNYKDAANSNLQWYLPAMGELGFLIPRFELINQSIQAVGGTPVEEDYFWSSSEYYSNDWGLPESYAWALSTDYGLVNYANGKDGNLLVRALALV